MKRWMVVLVLGLMNCNENCDNDEGDPEPVPDKCDTRQYCAEQAGETFDLAHCRTAVEQATKDANEAGCLDEYLILSDCEIYASCPLGAQCDAEANAYLTCYQQ